MNRYRFYKNTWIYLEESQEKLLSSKEASCLLKKRGWMIRNTYDFDTKKETSFWFVIKDSFEDIVITSDMITGFDTSSLGQKRLTISYKGLVVIFDYLVTSEIKAIEVVSGWTKDYLVNTTNIYEGKQIHCKVYDGCSYSGHHKFVHRSCEDRGEIG